MGAGNGCGGAAQGEQEQAPTMHARAVDVAGLRAWAAELQNAMPQNIKSTIVHVNPTTFPGFFIFVNLLVGD